MPDTGAPISALDDEAPLPGWRHPLTRYWAWRRRCDEHGDGAHLYQRWSRWTFLVDLLLEQWTFGFSWDNFDSNRYWSVHFGPIVVCWSGPSAEGSE